MRTVISHNLYTCLISYVNVTIKCLCVCTDLLPSVDDVLCIRQSVDTGPSYNRVMSGRGMGHFHCTELKKRLTQRHPAEQHLPGIQTQMDAVNSKVKILLSLLLSTYSSPTRQKFARNTDRNE